LLAYKIINQIVAREEEAEIVVKLIKNDDNEKDNESKSRDSELNQKKSLLVNEFFEKSFFDYSEEVKGNNYIPHKNYIHKSFSQKINKFFIESK